MTSAGVAVSLIRNDSISSPRFLAHQFSPLEDESITIYLAMSGSMIPMRVLESDSIESVKLQIQTFQGFVVRNQKLVCGGRELSRSNSLVRDYGVMDGNVLHLVLRLSDLQLIHVRTACGKEFTFHVERNRDVGYVKKEVAKKAKGLGDLDDQEILCDGKKLEDQRLIDNICKQNDAVLHLFVRKSAKFQGRPVKKNFELSIVATKLQNDNKNSRRNYDGIKKENRSYDVVKKEHEVDEESVLNKVTEKDLWLKPIILNPKAELSSSIVNMINSTSDGLACGHDPVRSTEGTGGVYFMKDASGQKYVSVFKPIDEEPMAVNNPRGLPVSSDGEGLKKGTKVGEGAFREVAAFILDHPKNGHRALFSDEIGFAGVPPTVPVTCLHKGFHHPGDMAAKVGSLQMFMENRGSCEDMGPGSFPVDEVHKISVLDMRLANADRHAGNILLSKKEKDGSAVLIPIDHGYCLPKTFEDCTFEWLYWPQAHQPYSSETCEYIRKLDAEEDIALLKFHGWDLPVESARTLRISTMLLKKGVERGFTPFQIGSIMCRETLNKESIIEEIISEAEDSVLPESSEAAFLETVTQIMDCRLDEIAGSLS